LIGLMPVRDAHLIRGPFILIDTLIAIVAVD